MIGWPAGQTRHLKSIQGAAGPMNPRTSYLRCASWDIGAPGRDRDCPGAGFKYLQIGLTKISGPSLDMTRAVSDDTADNRVGDRGIPAAGYRQIPQPRRWPRSQTVEKPQGFEKKADRLCPRQLPTLGTCPRWATGNGGWLFCCCDARLSLCFERVPRRRHAD